MEVPNGARKVRWRAAIAMGASCMLTGCTNTSPADDSHRAASSNQATEQNSHIPQYIKDGMQQQQERLKNTSQAMAAKAKAYESQSKR